MRVLKKVLEYASRKDGTFYLVPLGDIHFGHPNCDVDLVEGTVDFIGETHNCLWLGMGDYADAISPKDWRFRLDSIDLEYSSPDKQYRWIRELFAPIAEKCIGLLDGNHDLKHWKEHAHNYVDSLAYDLKIPYLTIDSYIRLIFRRRPLNSNATGSQTVNIYAHHGWTGARTPGGRINRILDLANIFPGLDLYLQGHVHQRGEIPPQTQLFVDGNMNLKHQEQNFVFTGSYLKGYVDGSSSYVEEKTLLPAALGSPLIQIDIDKSRDGKYQQPRLKVVPLSVSSQ
jgi:hypothetical protein